MNDSAIENICNDLREIVRKNDADYVRDFEACLEKAAALNDEALIKPLIGFFDDTARYDEVMFSIIHMIEDFSDHVYLIHLLEATPQFIASAPDWASTVFIRVINNNATRDELARQVANAPAIVRNAVCGLMERINQDDLAFLPKTREIIAAAG